MKFKNLNNVVLGGITVRYYHDIKLVIVSQYNCDIFFRSLARNFNKWHPRYIKIYNDNEI